MDIKSLIEIITDESNDVVYENVKKLVEGGKADLISKTFAKYEDAISEYIDEEEEEGTANQSLALDLYKGISKLILALGKALAVNNFETIDEAYDVQEFSQGYIEDYKYLVENYFEDDDREIEEMNNIYDEIKSVFDDADYED
ncbi:MAG: hypothetical protein MJ245_05660 [Clostridia bacterium]|nr:hypothetical protein [Clostridia bacterium]